MDRGLITTKDTGEAPQSSLKCLNAVGRLTIVPLESGLCPLVEGRDIRLFRRQSSSRARVACENTKLETLANRIQKAECHGKAAGTNLSLELQLPLVQQLGDNQRTVLAHAVFTHGPLTQQQRDRLISGRQLRKRRGRNE